VIDRQESDKAKKKLKKVKSPYIKGKPEAVENPLKQKLFRDPEAYRD